MKAPTKTPGVHVLSSPWRRTAVTPDARRLAYTSNTGDQPRRACCEHVMTHIYADLPGDRTVGSCYCGEYMDTGTWDERNA